MKRILFLFLALPLLSHAQIITTIAGNGMTGTSGDGGPATDAQLYLPIAVAVDHSGNVYIATQDDRVRKVNISGMITTVAGNGSHSYNGDEIPATSAMLAAPVGLATDGNGNLYIADGANHRIRKVNTAGIITTYAGTGISGYSGDGGPATAAQINPAGVTVDNIGNVYVAHADCNRVRKIDTLGIITTVAGNGFGCMMGVGGNSGDGGPATAAELHVPMDVAVAKGSDFSGIYIADYLNYRIRFVNSAGIIISFAGGGTGGFGNGGPASAAELNGPTGITTDTWGNVYIADQPNSSVRIINTSGIITTFAGNYTAGFSGDGGPASAAQLNHPQDIAVDDFGNVYIDDLTNNRIRKVSSTHVKIDILSSKNEIIDVYPNPAKNELIVSSSAPVNHIDIFNVFGQQVTGCTYLQKADGKLYISIESLEKGVYFLKTNSYKINKFIKY